MGAGKSLSKSERPERVSVPRMTGCFELRFIIGERGVVGEGGRYSGGRYSGGKAVGRELKRERDKNKRERDSYCEERGVQAPPPRIAAVTSVGEIPRSARNDILAQALGMMCALVLPLTWFFSSLT